VKQESPGFCPGEVQVTITDVPKKLMPVKTLQTTTPAAPPASAPANYTIDAFAFSTDGTSTPDCTPSEMKTSSTATGTPLTATSGLSTTAATLKFSGCQ